MFSRRRALQKHFCRHNFFNFAFVESVLKIYLLRHEPYLSNTKVVCGLYLSYITFFFCNYNNFSIWVRSLCITSRLNTLNSPNLLSTASCFCFNLALLFFICLILHLQRFLRAFTCQVSFHNWDKLLTQTF